VTKKATWPCSQKFNVSIDRGSYDVKCECKNFEFRGILCNHMVYACFEEDVLCVPEKYILNRWRKDLVRDYTKISVPYFTPEKKNLQPKRYLALQKEFDDIISVATIDEKSSSLSQVKTLVKECQEVPRNVGTFGKVYGRHPLLGREVENDNQGGDVGHHDKVKDPVDRRGKWKKPSHRKGYENELLLAKSKKRAYNQAFEYSHAYG
ncbi:Protein FAR1-RELATED SEQUENCE 4, partial [Bienertia sinuspersici]